MNNDTKIILRNILILIAIGIIVILLAHLFFFLLPILLIAWLFYIIYKYLKTKDKESKKDNIEDAEVVKERFDK